MSGNAIGGAKAAAKNKAKDPDFYKKIGQVGGSAKVPKGFAKNKELARIAGSKGGKISKAYSKNPKRRQPVDNTSPQKPENRLHRLVSALADTIQNRSRHE